MNRNTKLLFLHKVLYDIYFYGAITIPFFVSKGYGVSAALAFASLYMVISIVTEIPTGIIGDRYGHKLSVLFGSFLTGCAMFGLLVLNNVVWDGTWIILFAVGSALTSGSDVALIRFASSNFERDNRIFDYLKSVMLLLSFGSAGFIATYFGINTAIFLSGILAFASMLPLFFMRIDAPSSKALRETFSVREQTAGLPTALRKVRGGLSLVLLAGLVGAITFSAKEIISSLNPVYDIDLNLIGIIAALAMVGRIAGTAIEKRLKVGQGTLLFILTVLVGATTLIEVNRHAGVVLLLLSTVAAQMLFYQLKYQLSSEAPRSYVASLVSSLSLAGRLISGIIIMITGIFAGMNVFHISFIAVGLILALFGGALAARLRVVHH